MHCYVASLTVFVGPFAFTDVIPLSIADADEYVSLFPIVWPLVALRTKSGSPRWSSCEAGKVMLLGNGLEVALEYAHVDERAVR